MSAAPLPTRLVLLNDLPKLDTGTKVRLLGCVTNYNSATGILSLTHPRPVSNLETADPSSNIVVSVDINLLLDAVKTTDTQIGEWVNVIGYLETKVTGIAKNGAAKSRNYVQGIMLWSAGPIKLREYERALKGRHEVCL
ncbi:hypothetical protein MMC09_004227 [Bachmanniomyces sp. S44760]|nr:hypothetical protein [Bachmanniomyces sp. S44760]